MARQPVPVDEQPVDDELLSDEEPIVEDLSDELSDDMITDREEAFVRGYQDEAESGWSES